jgi:hypothetical protein
LHEPGYVGFFVNHYLVIKFFRTINTEIKPLVSKMGEDQEFDVRYFADEAKEGNLNMFGIHII